MYAQFCQTIFPTVLSLYTQAFQAWSAQPTSDSAADQLEVTHLAFKTIRLILMYGWAKADANPEAVVRLTLLSFSIRMTTNPHRPSSTPHSTTFASSSKSGYNASLKVSQPIDATSRCLKVKPSPTSSSTKACSVMTPSPWPLSVSLHSSSMLVGRSCRMRPPTRRSSSVVRRSVSAREWPILKAQRRRAIVGLLGALHGESLGRP